MKKTLLLLLPVIFLLFSCCAKTAGGQAEVSVREAQPVTEPEDPVQTRLRSMDLAEKVGQLFMVTPEALEGVNADAQLNGSTGEAVTQMGDALAGAIKRYRPGGIILFYQNILDKEQITEFTSALQATGEIPLLIAVDEEGGRVARIANNENFMVPRYESMEAVGAAGDAGKAYEAANSIGKYLRRFGFTLDLAPVADVNSNPANRVIGDRSFGSDAALVADMVTAAQKGFADAGVLSCLKHFPGHGDTAGDTHEGFVSLEKTWDELLEGELIPFRAAIGQGADCVMASHIACPLVTGDELPASLSYTLITEKLRTELGFDGVVITDGMNMGAITTAFSSGEAAVKAIEAGVDIVLAPYDFNEAYHAVLDAVSDGRLTEARIDESVKRILTLKAEQENMTIAE